MLKFLSTTVFFLCLVIVLNINFISVSAENNTLKLSTDKDIYNIGENITITLQNIGNTTVEFSDSGYMHLMNSDTGECIWSCPGIFHTMAIIPFEPGQIESLIWEQRDENGTQVSAGLYKVWVSGRDSAEASTQFTITNRSSEDINTVNGSSTDLSKGYKSHSSSSDINLTSIILESQNQIEKNLNKASEAIKLNDSLAANQSIEQARQEMQQLAICATSIY
jgi:hypothetical protein